MKLPVDSLSETPESFDFEGSAEWWQEAFDRVGLPAPGLPRPLALHVSAHLMGEDLFLDTTARGEVDLECGRCLARYRQELREVSQLVLEPAGGREPADPEGATALARDGLWLGEDLHTGWYRGSEVDLGPFFLEITSLAVPLQPLCNPGCQGLCGTCGRDLNESTCECSQSTETSPFAILATLRRSDGG